MQIKISEQAIEVIRLHAREDYPHECCGALLGTEENSVRTVHDVLRLANERVDERERRYFISPQQVLMVERKARTDGLLLLGYYHSHPDHPAVPSEFDRLHALPWYSYLIISVRKGEPREILAWLLREDRSQFDEQECETT
jgi:proteasome lid subunit RPN8/RPN11